MTILTAGGQYFGHREETMTYKIIPCENGVGEWEAVGKDIATQVFDLRTEAE